jgi:hypothetical protein
MQLMSTRMPRSSFDQTLHHNIKHQRGVVMNAFQAVVRRFLFAFLVLAAPLASAQSVLDFTIENQTGFAFKELYISASNKDDWGKNLLSTPLKDGASKKMKANPKASATVYDMRAVYSDGKAVVWKEIEPAKFARLTLKWNKDTGKTSITKHRS